MMSSGEREKAQELRLFAAIMHAGMIATGHISDWNDPPAAALWYADQLQKELERRRDPEEGDADKKE